MLSSAIQRAFMAGELAPAFHARADEARYVAGLRTCKNWIVRKEGGVSNRPGFRFVHACKTTGATVQIFPFLSEETGESLLIENGDGYFRFYKAGALVQLAAPPAAWDSGTTYAIGDLVEDGGTNYYATAAGTNHTPGTSPDFWYAMPPEDIFELPSPFGANLPWPEQDGRVITLTHTGHAPMELVYGGLTTWALQTVSTAPTVPAPTGLVLTPGAAGTRYAAYVVTAAQQETFEESIAGSVVSNAAVAEPTEAAPHVLTWDAVPNAAEYYVYGDPFGNGVFGYLGTTVSNGFDDVGFTPDFAITPPLPRVLFETLLNYPARSASFQQRRFFARTLTLPDAIWGSRIGFPSNFGISSPLQEDDAITFRLRGKRTAAVRWMVDLKTLAVGTEGGIWTVGEPKVPLTPEAIPADRETFAGAADQPPVVLGNTIVYVQARGSIVRDVRFDQQVEGLNGRDLTSYAAHLFEGVTIRKIAYQEVPHSIIWAVRSDGILLGLTYLPEWDVWGWHWHETQQNTTLGLVEDVAVVPEADEDAVYVIVKRTIGGSTKRYIERLASRVIRDFDADAFFVDSGLSYSGAPADTFSGLDHLEGQTVAVVADGAVIYDGNPAGSQAATYKVTGGAITLPADYTDVHIGLAIRYADLETLDLDATGTDIRAKRKRVGELGVLVDRSARSFWAGPSTGALRQYRRPDWEPTADEHTGLLTLKLSSTFGDYGRVLIRVTDPLPVTILGILPGVELAG